MDVVLRRALDRCDCARCRSLAQQLDALIPTPSHIAAYVAMGVALALTAVFAAMAAGWTGVRLLGMAGLVGTGWFASLMAAMAWGGARLTQPDPLAWSVTGSVWPGWSWVTAGIGVAYVVVHLATGGPGWLLVLVVALFAWLLVRRAKADRRRRAECVRDRTGWRA